MFTNMNKPTFGKIRLESENYVTMKFFDNEHLEWQNLKYALQNFTKRTLRNEQFATYIIHCACMYIYISLHVQ